MIDVEFSAHARDALRERNIPEEWVALTMDSPDSTEVGPDNTLHYVKAIGEYARRFPRVVVNPYASPIRVVTVSSTGAWGGNRETESR
ncbi:MAG: DUF4258 domain-containing protein [Dehalococcoidia bacterium]